MRWGRAHVPPGKKMGISLSYTGAWLGGTHEPSIKEKWERWALKAWTRDSFF